MKEDNYCRIQCPLYGAPSITGRVSVQRKVSRLDKHPSYPTRFDREMSGQCIFKSPTSIGIPLVKCPTYRGSTVHDIQVTNCDLYVIMVFNTSKNVSCNRSLLCFSWSMSWQQHKQPFQFVYSTDNSTQCVGTDSNLFWPIARKRVSPVLNTVPQYWLSAEGTIIFKASTLMILLFYHLQESGKVLMKNPNSSKLKHIPRTVS